jgi:hypothetical protein
MAHVGKDYPYSFARDLYLWFGDWHVPPKFWKTIAVGGFTGTLSAGWNAFHLSEAGVADYTVGEIRWLFHDLAGTDHGTAMEVVMRVHHNNSFDNNSFHCRVGIDGIWSPYNVTAFPGRAPIWDSVGNQCLINVPGRGTFSFGGAGIRAALWADL